MLLSLGVCDFSKWVSNFMMAAMQLCILIAFFFFFIKMMHSEKKRSRTSGKWETGNRKGYSLKDNLFGFKCKIYYLINWFTCPCSL